MKSKSAAKPMQDERVSWFQKRVQKFGELKCAPVAVNIKSLSDQAPSRVRITEADFSVSV